MILTCDCKSVGQDMLHGYGKRVHNLAGDGQTAKCSVCGSSKSVSKAAAADSKKK